MVTDNSTVFVQRIYKASNGQIMAWWYCRCCGKKYSGEYGSEFIIDKLIELHQQKCLRSGIAIHIYHKTVSGAILGKWACRSCGYADHRWFNSEKLLMKMAELHQKRCQTAA